MADAEVAVTLSLGTNPGGASLNGTQTVTTTAGVATFSGLWLDKAATGYTLAASTAGTVTDAESAAFDIVAAAPAQLAFGVQPTTTKVSRVISPAVEVEIQDEFGNLTSATDPVTLALSDNPIGAELTGTTTVSAVDGVATFSDLFVDDPASLTLRATSGAFAGTRSDSFAATLLLYVANTGSDDVTVIEASTNSVVTTVPVGSGPRLIDVTPDGTRAYVTLIVADSLAVVNLTDNTLSTTVKVGDGPRGVAVTPDGTRAYVANSFSDDVSVVDLSTNTVVTTIPLVDGPRGVAITPDGSEVYVANEFADTVSVIRTSDNSVADEFQTGSQPWAIAITPDGAVAYVTEFAADSVSAIDVEFGLNFRIDQFAVGRRPAGVTFSPDGVEAYVAIGPLEEVSIISTAANAVRDRVRSGRGPRQLAVSPGGRLLYVTNAFDDNVAVISTATRRVIDRITVGD